MVGLAVNFLNQLSHLPSWVKLLSQTVFGHFCYFLQKNQRLTELGDKTQLAQNNIYLMLKIS
jgi:hypothetical protein